MPCKQRSKYTSAELNGECLVARKEESNPYERNTGKVPEDDHETPFLVEHIPSLRDAFFALAARVEIEPGREDHEGHVLTDCQSSRLSERMIFTYRRNIAV